MAKKDKHTHVGRIEVDGVGSVLVTAVKSETTGRMYLTVSVEAGAEWEVVSTTHGTAQLVVVQKDKEEL